MHYSVEDKIRIVLDGLRGEASIAAPFRREGIAESMYCTLLTEGIPGAKRRLAADYSISAARVRRISLPADDDPGFPLPSSCRFECRVPTPYGHPRAHCGPFVLKFRPHLTASTLHLVRQEFEPGREFRAPTRDPLAFGPQHLVGFNQTVIVKTVTGPTQPEHATLVLSLTRTNVSPCQGAGNGQPTCKTAVPGPFTPKLPFDRP
jgi:hypothetical protein